MASHATTVRPSSNALLLIDSEDRFKDYDEARAATDYNASPYDFTITKNQSLMNGSFTRLAVTEVTFPWTIPNIKAKTNKIQLLYTDRTGEVQSAVVIIPVGFYTPAELATMLETKLNAAVVGLTGIGVSYALDDRPRFEFIPPTGTSIGFAPMPYNIAAYQYPPTTKQLFDLLGLTAASTTVSATNFYGNTSFAQAIRYVDIVCPQLTYNQAVKDTMSQPISRDSLCRIYLGDLGNSGDFTTVGFSPPGCAPGVIHRQFNPAKYIQWDPAQPVPGFLQFQVVDDAGAVLDAAYGADWSLTMQASEN